MNTENKLYEQLDALNKMNLDELRDLCRKYYPGAKNCRSKMLLRKKISFIGIVYRFDINYLSINIQ